MTLSPTLRETLHRVFGPDALRGGLFYHHEGSLRFELSDGHRSVPMFTRAYDRARAILDRVFAGSSRVVAVLSFYGELPPRAYLSVFRALRECGVRVPRPRATWTDVLDGELAPEAWHRVAFEVDADDRLCLLWGALAADLGIRPRLQCHVYLADPERGVLAYPYDDRGMDLIGPNKALLKEVYAEFNAWLLDYDRATMDACFGGGAGPV